MKHAICRNQYALYVPSSTDFARRALLERVATSSKYDSDAVLKSWMIPSDYSNKFIVPVPFFSGTFTEAIMGSDKDKEETEQPAEGENKAEEDAEEKKGDDEVKTKEGAEKPAEEDNDEEKEDDEPAMQLRIEIRHDDDDKEEEASPPKSKKKKPSMAEELALLNSVVKEVVADPKIAQDMEFIKNSTPSSKLEIALYEALERKDTHIQRLTGEVTKLKAFISKRKQTYKRKRKDQGAPTRALSAYNIFVQDRFAKLAKENEAALNNADSDAQLKRVPPANLVATTGNQWKELPAEEKVQYEERAKGDRKRYEEQMAQYQPPDKQANRKRNKTGYNMFFSAHVLRLKQSEMGVPSERGSVARLVGTAWKVSRDERIFSLLYTFLNRTDKCSFSAP